MSTPKPDPLNSAELGQLATYNAELVRGLIHTDEWAAQMLGLQHRFDWYHYPDGPAWAGGLVPGSNP